MNTVDENRVAKKKQSGKIGKKDKIDWMMTLLPLGLIAALSILFFLLPEQSNTVLAKVRFFLGDTFGVYYLAIGLGVFLLSLYLAFSKYGDIVLGEQDEFHHLYSCFLFLSAILPDPAYFSSDFSCPCALLSLYLAFSKYGDIVLGEQDEKPKYSFFAWGSMMFTCGLAADILFYSFAEWVMYAAEAAV